MDKAVSQRFGKRFAVRRLLQAAIAYPHAGRLDDQVALLFEVIEGGDDSFTRLIKRSARRLSIERVPGATMFGQAKNVAEEFGPRGVELLQDLGRRSLRLKLELGVERPCEVENVFQLEIRE